MELTRRAVVAGGAAVAATNAIAAKTKSPVGELAVQLNAAAAQALNDRACPGVQVAIWQHGTPVLSRGFGLANIETASSVSPRTIFRVGSLTKQFTAAAIIKLASERKLRAEGQASEYLDAMKRLPPLTLLELMNHTAGLRDDAQEASCPPGAAGPKSQLKLAEDLAAQGKPLDFRPGTAWLYSNANYIVLGAVIEKVTGKPLAAALQELVFQPLHLRSTAFDQSADVVVNRASGYTALENKAEPFANAKYIEISEAGGAGGMRSSASDLCAWHTALLSGRLFGKQYISLMTTPGRLRDGRLSGANRFSPDDATYGDVQYACGLLVQDKGPLGRVVTHNGFINGFSAVLETHLDRKLSFAVLCNADVGPTLPFRAVRRAVVGSVAA